MSTEGLPIMSSDWMKLERTIGCAEHRLWRRVRDQAWLIQFHNFKKHLALKVGRTWTTSLLRSQGYPGWYDKTKLSLAYDEVSLLAAEARTLVLRLRAIKYHGSTVYIDPSHTKVPRLRDYDIRSDIA